MHSPSAMVVSDVKLYSQEICTESDKALWLTADISVREPIGPSRRCSPLAEEQKIGISWYAI